MVTTGDSVPPGRSKSPLRFASFILDLEACALTRDSGDAVSLTRSEFALLRFLVERHGRVASRETLLDAIAKRPFVPFDRSIDVVVGRLRRKIETDPRRPHLIVTVPGEGYRFDGAVQPATRASSVSKASEDGAGNSLTLPSSAAIPVQAPSALFRVPPYWERYVWRSLWRSSVLGLTRKRKELPGAFCQLSS